MAGNPSREPRFRSGAKAMGYLTATLGGDGTLLIRSTRFLGQIVAVATVLPACGTPSSTSPSRLSAPSLKAHTRSPSSLEGSHGADGLPAESCPLTSGDQGLSANTVALRVEAHDGFDRLIFEFEPDGDRLSGTPKPNQSGVPNAIIRRVTPPFEYDPTAEPLSVAGQAFVKIGFTGSRAPGATFPKHLVPELPMLRQVEEQADFHGAIYWILGLSEDRCWSIRELAHPPRLVMDLPHDSS